MLKAVIFDLNGIFIQSPRLSDRFKKDFNIDTSLFLPKLANIMEKARKPEAEPIFRYWKDVLKEWKLDFTEKKFLDYWFKGEVQSEKMIAFAKHLREQGLKVFILSNNFKERADYYNQYPWMREAIDKVYFSWQTGFVKPDPRAWQFILSENNLKSEECIYFDDQQKNLDAAEVLGIKSYLFTQESELEKIINEILSNTF